MAQLIEGEALTDEQGAVSGGKLAAEEKLEKNWEEITVEMTVEHLCMWCNGVVSRVIS